MSIKLAKVRLWGTDIALISWNQAGQFADFQYTPEFIGFGIEVAPLMMPVRKEPYRFTALSFETFKGLPGMLADVLPDKYGNAIIDQWLIREKRAPDSFNPVERLCYTGNRAMGALEFSPATSPSEQQGSQDPIEIEKIVTLVNKVMRSKNYELTTAELGTDEMSHILQVGTSAGGARAKAIINWNQTTGVIVAGHKKPDKGFDSWLIKFDGIDENSDKELADPKGFSRIEYAYHLLATRVGINMSPCQLLEEGGRAHFLTKRFDRIDGQKIHKSSLCGMGHYDFNMRNGTSYEQLMVMAHELQLKKSETQQLFLRMVFNVVFRNQDDHTKNTEFLMDRNGVWSLSPAFDITYSYNPKGDWTATHQMTINGKSSDFKLDDLLHVGKLAGISKYKSKAIINTVLGAKQDWPELAQKSGIDPKTSEAIRCNFRDFKN
jgi:serine/threonine-protein kinase HipA